jgi:DNA invertase Pin-like site-specific DNA recombinase
MKVAIYARVSTKDKGQSVDNQLPDLRAYAVAHGYTLYKEYTEEESGGNEYYSCKYASRVTRC